VLPGSSRVPYRSYAFFSDICGACFGFGFGFGIGFTLLLTRSFTRSSSRHPPFTQYTFPSRSLVCDGQTSPHMPRLVVPHSTCPSLSPSPPRTQLYNRSCSNKHTPNAPCARNLPHQPLSLSRAAPVTGVTARPRTCLFLCAPALFLCAGSQSA
jgi:hypothetical protein